MTKPDDPTTMALKLTSRGGIPPQAVPVWRTEPYRVLFPMGMLMAWAGVLHWFLHAVGVTPYYGSVFHSITQIQGFMMCFAVGFLFTMIPRRTGTAPPSAWQMAVAIAAPAGTTISAWFEVWWLSQIFWLALVAMLLIFIVKRFLTTGSGRKHPNSFIWLPLSLMMGMAGSMFIGAYGYLGQEYFWVHDFGRLLLLQGMFIGLILGIGGMLIPMITHGDALSDAAVSRRDYLARVGHLCAAVLLVLSFWTETFSSLRGGLALRAVVVAALLLTSSKAWRLPRNPGWHRKLVWLAAWMIPLGYALAAIFPAEKKAGLHVVFIGGFALMTFSVGLHVVLAHGGFQRLVNGRPWQVAVFGSLFLIAMALRAMVDFDRSHFFLWLGASAAVFLMGTLFWAWLVVPRIWTRSNTV
jgi:uncharacterized protein involved in response to NO